MLLIFGFWVNSLPLPEESIVRKNDVIILGQNQKLDVNAEYQALIGSGYDKVILAAFRGKILVKLYQLPGFGVNVPREIDLKRARDLTTGERLKYLQDNTSVKTIQEAYMKFANHLKNEKTDVFFGKFGDGFKDTKVYEGFYAHNPLTRNMMFFREDPEAVGGYSLHSYMNLRPVKNDELQRTHSLF